MHRHFNCESLGQTKVVVIHSVHNRNFASSVKVGRFPSLIAYLKALHKGKLEHLKVIKIYKPGDDYKEGRTQ